MIHSMTGFGRASGTLSARYTITVTAKSVNHRFLEVGVRLPEFLWELEPGIRAIASEAFSRGKLDVSVRVQRTSQLTREADARCRRHTDLPARIFRDSRRISRRMPTRSRMGRWQI